jgi:hypothetical protein
MAECEMVYASQDQLGESTRVSGPIRTRRQTLQNVYRAASISDGGVARTMQAKYLDAVKIQLDKRV